MFISPNHGRSTTCRRLVRKVGVQLSAPRLARALLGTGGPDRPRFPAGVVPIAPARSGGPNGFGTSGSAQARTAMSILPAGGKQKGKPRAQRR